MLHGALTLPTLASIAGALGFGGSAGAAAGVAQVRLLGLPVAFALPLVAGRRPV